MEKELSKDFYVKERRKAKVLKVLAPITFWGGLALGVLFLILAFKNSFGNLAEIFSLLDSKTHTAVELEQNCQALIERYGVWEIGTKFDLRFLNLSKAIFPAILFVFLTLSILCFVCAFVLGKWLFPMLSKSIQENMQDKVNVAFLNDKEKKE